MATIKDVAAIAGVSFTTVSHVVNNSRPVSADVRAKVERAIRELNYVPSAVARSLKARSTATIGLVVPNSTNPYFAELARGIEDQCALSGYCVFLCNSLAQTLADTREPLVVVDRNIEGLPADLVQIDHERGAYLATRHLLELGHAKIGCITGAVSTAVSAMRVHGFIRAMAERGIDIVPGAIAESDFSCMGGYHAAVRLFDSVRPSAIFAGNDLMGLGALRAAAERGIRVPADCSIIGFDDIELSRYTYPALSTVGQSVRALGEMAAQTLIERIGGGASGAPQRRRVVSPRLVLRESTTVYVEPADAGYRG
ncbi:LacI family DNA-binding transcriptional regulator [Burkholderia pseudomallei]|uniref:LacI family DNA-binding transcriptional regulator n=1 Tax=Burkholderia pseudomallei TaxID=28450 RepID=UPI000F051DA6|nr:LacI family DNA-binding transcriptional regulator [Burkholderia pseudomallei]VBN88988.1 ribose operon repressor RbsR [Burkholderia pseudomallei]